MANLTVNGKTHDVDADPDTPLLWVLREWIGMTGLPFVFAFWAGRPGVATPGAVAKLNAARDRGLAEPERVAARYFPGDSARIRRGAEYLRENVKYDFGERELAGLRRFYALAHAVGIAADSREPVFY